MVIVGALPSDVMVMRSEDVLPAASLAVTVMTLAPVCSARPCADHDVVPEAMPLPPRSFDHRTSVTPKTSDAVPPSVSVAAVVVSVSAAVGAVIAIDGATASVSVMVRTSVATLPAASLAVTVMTLAPGCKETLATDHAVVPVATPLPPLSLDQLTCDTPNASLAVPPSASVADVVEKVVAAVGVAIEIVGAVPSVIVTVTAALLALPAESLAVTVMRLAPGLSGTEADHEVVPDAVPLPPWLFDQLTCVTPPRSAATPVTVTV